MFFYSTPLSGVTAEDGYEVSVAFSVRDALMQLNQSFDLFLIDVGLPDGDGISLAKTIREHHTQGIIFISAKDDESTILSGFDLGGDDYITKPFSNRELVARVKANLRRQSNTQASVEEEAVDRLIEIGDIAVHPAAYNATKNGEELDLTHREYELLHYLAQHVGEVMTRENLLETVWGYDYFGDVRTVDVTVRRLREKIEDNPSHPTYLITRRGVGYYLRDPESQES